MTRSEAVSIIKTLDLAARKCKKAKVDEETVTGCIALALEEMLWILDNESEEDEPEGRSLEGGE